MLSSKVPTLQSTVYLLWGCDFSELQFLLLGRGDGLQGGQVTTGVGCTDQGTAATGAPSSPAVISLTGCHKVLGKNKRIV